MQGYQARVAALLVETELELRQRLRSAANLDGIEAAAKGVADGFARRLVEDLLAGADEVVAKSLPRSWRVVGFRTRNLLSTVGRCASRAGCTATTKAGLACRSMRS